MRLRRTQRRASCWLIALASGNVNVLAQQLRTESALPATSVADSTHVAEANRELAEQDIAGQDLIREPLKIPTP